MSEWSTIGGCAVQRVWKKMKKVFVVVLRLRGSDISMCLYLKSAHRKVLRHKIPNTVLVFFSSQHSQELEPACNQTTVLIAQSTA